MIRSFSLSRIALLTASLSLLAVTACGAPAEDEEVAASTSDLSGTLSATELAATKASLRRIANANMSRTDNFDEVRAEVEPLVAKLAKHFGKQSAAKKLPLVEGAWHQLWSDFPYPMTSFISMDPKQIYQVVNADGHYWNIGDQKAIGLFGLTGVLRGAFVPNGTKIDLQFTNVGFRFGRLNKKTNLEELANGLESGDDYYTGIPGGGKAPNGPINIKGTLETLYVDADLRVDQGTQEDFLDKNGDVAVSGYGPKFFILDRVITPAK